MAKILLDSGAFTFWTKTGEVPLEDYAEFVVENQGAIEHAINLDAIPSKTGQDYKQPPIVSFENWLKLRELGANTLPVIHYGEDPSWVRAYLSEGADYICVGGLVKKRYAAARMFLDTIFAHICGPNGYPVCKVHGLGVHNVDLTRRYPWTSVDSSYWLYHGNYGNVIIPGWTSAGGRHDFSRKPYIYSCGHGNHRIHLKNMSAVTLCYVEAYLNAWFGFSFDALKDRDILHWVNLLFFTEFLKVQKPKPFKRPPGLFQPEAPAHDGIRPDKLRIYFVESLNPGTAEILTRSSAPDRLVSYAFLKGRDDVDLDHYAQTGLVL